MSGYDVEEIGAAEALRYVARLLASLAIRVVLQNTGKADPVRAFALNRGGGGDSAQKTEKPGYGQAGGEANV